MGNKITKPRRLFVKRLVKPVNPNNNNNNEVPTEEVYVETIYDANFTWLDSRRISDNSNESIYLFGRYSEETDQLSHLMHIIFKYVLKGNTRITLTPPMKNCLHIGAGHYIWLVEMANDYKEIQFEGFDITCTTENNPIPLPPNANLHCGDIFSGLPYPDESFDYINVRNLFTWISDEQILFVLEEIKRVTKPNGWVEILEIDPFVKNATPYYEDNLGAIWKNICKSRGLNSSNIINLDKLLCKLGFANVKSSKLSIPIGKYGGKVGELYAKQIINGSNAVASLIMDKLEMTHEEIQNYLQECIREFNLRQSYSNSYLFCANRI